MVLDQYREEADRLLSPAAKRLAAVNPNHLSILSLASAFIAGIFFSLEPAFYIILGALMVSVNGLLDALDGKVARLQPHQSARGDFVDHVIDRYSDVFILAGIALGVHCSVFVGLFAVIGVMLASYMGTQAQALGLKRMYRGILGRADRLALLIAIPIIQYCLMELDVGLGEDLLGYSLIGWMMLYFGIAGNVTAVQRAHLIWKSLS
ncbi:MAG: CDP-alcohol phosphatidyltransferase family protein [Methanobacteriota archaeon]|nr:MAG: CDP-alcohol phosphatidyltransferase family protein [Euryarchaeota archaeon]